MAIHPNQLRSEPTKPTLDGIARWIRQVFNNTTSVIGSAYTNAEVYADDTSHADGSGGTEDDLATYSAANLLTVDGQHLLVAGIFAGDGADSVTLQLYVGSSVFAVNGVIAGGAAGNQALLLAWIRRNSASELQGFAILIRALGTLLSVKTIAATAITWANSNTVKCTGTRTSGSGSANITQQGFRIWRF